MKKKVKRSLWFKRLLKYRKLMKVRSSSSCRTPMVKVPCQLMQPNHQRLKVRRLKLMLRMKERRTMKSTLRFVRLIRLQML